jgi:maleate isomerase
MHKLKFDTLAADHAKRLGLIVLQSDVTIEDEFRYYFAGLQISLLLNRIPFENEVTVASLKQMEGHLSASMALFPNDAEFDCMGYGCTSGALHIGNERIASLVDAARPCAAVSNPMLAAITAMCHVDAKRIGFLAPYSEAVSQTMVDEFERRGIQVVVAATFDESQDRIVGRIAPASIRKACIALVKNQHVDAIFVACTNMKCAQIIPEIEHATGVMAMSSNQVLAWHMAKLAGVEDKIHGKGRLFEYSEVTS